MTDSKSPFRPSFLKIERAQRHLAELTRVVQGYLDSDPAQITSSRKLEPGEPTNLPGGMLIGWRVDFKVDPAPDSISAIIGDVFHNLRSALDLMASTLATLNNKSSRKVYFPFADSADELTKQIKDKRFDRAGPAAEKLLREWQPYKGGNRELRAVHDLNVRDKHQELILQRTLSTFSTPIFDTRPEDGSSLKALPGTEEKSVRLVFPADCPLAEMELVSTLHKLVDLTASVIEPFEALGAPAG